MLLSSPAFFGALGPALDGPLVLLDGGQGLVHSRDSEVDHGIKAEKVESFC